MRFRSVTSYAIMLPLSHIFQMSDAVNLVPLLSRFLSDPCSHTLPILSLISPIALLPHSSSNSLDWPAFQIPRRLKLRVAYQHYNVLPSVSRFQTAAPSMGQKETKRLHWQDRGYTLQANISRTASHRIYL